VNVSQKGIDLIKSFEGLKLVSYVDAVGVLTIGYGHTGSNVYVNQVITTKEAEDLLRRDLSAFELSVSKLISIPLDQEQFDALVSFTFNCGAGALQESTLRKRLNNGENPNRVAKEELPKWVKGNNGPLPGLVRRREAELHLFCSGKSSGPPENRIDIKSAQQTWFKKEPVQSSELEKNQIAKVMQGRVYKKCLVLKKEAGHTQLELPGKLGIWWVFDKDWEGLGGRIVPARGISVNKDTFNRILLEVPYQTQRDNYTDASRTCFSSSCAMAAMYLKPELIKNDDAYLRKVFAIGDSTDSSVQVRVLKSLGLNAKFLQTGILEQLKARLLKGIPCPIGILHHGDSEHPSGGGHWICVIGFDDTKQTFYVNDPWGEIDHLSGQYIETNGAGLAYSYNLLRRRWTVEGAGTGWWIDLG